MARQTRRRFQRRIQLLSFFSYRLLLLLALFGVLVSSGMLLKRIQFFQRVTYAVSAVSDRVKASRGDSAAMYRLGRYLQFCGKQAEAVDWFTKGAQRGNSKAQNALGVCYFRGYYVIKDYMKAASWFDQAAAQGHNKARYNLAFCYLHGHGVSYDHAMAVAYYRQAAEDGYAPAQAALGRLYERGMHGCNKNEFEAARWYRLAAAQDYGRGQFLLARLYHTGSDVVRDHTLARHWYAKAASNHESMAPHQLGMMYERAEGGAQDYVQAMQWYQAGLASARTPVEQAVYQYELARFDWHGFAGEKNREKALQKMLNSAARGNALAKKWLKRHALAS